MTLRLRSIQRIACIAALLPLAPPTHAQTGRSLAPIVGVRDFPPSTYRADPQNSAIAVDNRGILYFGNATGVLEFDGTYWRLIELPGKRGVYALGRSAEGRILVGGEGEVGWLAPDRTGSMVYVSKSADLPEDFRATADRVIRIVDTPDGQVFLSDHWLFVRTPGGKLISIPSDSGDHFLQAAWFQGSLYVLDSNRGLTRLAGSALQDVAGGATTRGSAMLVTDAGLLIPSYNDGLVRYDPGSAKPWQLLNAKGWSPDDSADVTSGVALNPELFALGTAKHGVTLVDAEGNVVWRIGTVDGLASPSVFALEFDGGEGLWMALDQGLALASLNLPVDPNAMPFRAWVRSVVGTRDDRLLFGGTYTASQGGVPQMTQSSAQILTFPFEYNAFRFDYSANGLDPSGDMQFQTYLQGVDSGWSAWSTRTEREFTQLGSGTWVFKVRARKANGIISAEGSYELHIRPAWYDTWWFAVFQVLFVLGLLLLPGHAHWHKGFQDALTTLAVIVPFVYVGDWLTDLIGHYLSTNVGFVKVMMSALLAFALEPIQNLMRRGIEMRNHRRRLRLEAKLAAQDHHDSP